MTDREYMYTQRQTAAEYVRGIPGRLEARELIDRSLFNLAMRCHDGVGPDAFVSPVYVNDIRQRVDRVSLVVTYVDLDLRPVGKQRPSLMIDNFWRPDKILSLNSGDNSVSTFTKEGYFLPYRPETLADLARDFANLPKLADLGDSQSNNLVEVGQGQE